MITNEYTLIHSHKEIYQAILDEAKKENVELQKDYLFNDAVFLTTKDNKNGIVVSYKRSLDNDLAFFIFEMVDGTIRSLSSQN